ncbi:HTH-type transcriptional regulator BenM [Pseudoruegeria aquimaris]|uniref:HTH-type transcriptional regulator BenM n=1 Tax=Pseudoruegeria aquimaris TaxID=393663 RepID=A0A1Y5T663_9RHOB|nr:LysR family transcriptional regulator [Pseudoruegeria aquimaris]SLN53429.1 HTH-type transcriptional regulator BenM [Pseudoruegeria aquimaris]
MAIKIETLRCFCAVAEAGNLAEAADRLGRTQSAVSMTLKQLESHLGRKLFEGERKGRLSALGEQVFELSLRQVRQFDETVQAIEAAAHAANGQIRIASVPSVAALIFPGVLAHMTRAFPGAKVEMRDADTRQVLDALAEGKADIGIASGLHSVRGVRALPLFADRFGLVCSTAHPLMQAAEAPTVAAVLSAPFLRNALCDLIDEPGFAQAMERADVTIHNTQSLIAMVAAGRWVTILPEAVARILPDGTAFRPLADLSVRRQVYLYVREAPRFGHLSEACSQFILGLSLP